MKPPPRSSPGRSPCRARTPSTRRPHAAAFPWIGVAVSTRFPRRGGSGVGPRTPSIHATTRRKSSGRPPFARARNTSLAQHAPPRACRAFCMTAPGGPAWADPAAPRHGLGASRRSRKRAAASPAPISVARPFAGFRATIDPPSRPRPGSSAASEICKTPSPTIPAGGRSPRPPGNQALRGRLALVAQAAFRDRPRRGRERRRIDRQVFASRLRPSCNRGRHRASSEHDLAEREARRRQGQSERSSGIRDRVSLFAAENDAGGPYRCAISPSPARAAARPNAFMRRENLALEAHARSAGTQPDGPICSGQ